MAGGVEGQPGVIIPPRRPTRGEWLIITALMVLGALIRLIAAARAPGFWYDEALYALDGLNIFRNPGWPIFFDTGGHMREPLYIYLQGLLFLAVEPSAFMARALSAMIGTLTIPVVWLLAREWRGARFALPVAIVYTLLHWHIHFSSLAFRTILSPLFAALVFLFYLRMIARSTRADAILCGGFLGLGMYSYLSFRLVPFMMVAPMLLMLWQSSDRRRVLKLHGLIAAVSFTIFFPLAIDFIRNPEHLSGRSSEVNFLQREDAVPQLLKQVRDVALMGFGRGDHEPKHNLPGPPRFWQFNTPSPEDVAEEWDLEQQFARIEGRPAMDPHGTGLPLVHPAAGVLLYAGLIWLLIVSVRRPRELALASWLLIGSLASILSFGAPNLLRLLYLSPLAAMLLVRGMGLVIEAATWLGVRYKARTVAQALAALALALVLLVHVATELNRVAQWATHPMVPGRFNTELANLGQALAAQPDRLPVRLSAALGIAEHPTLVFIADGYDLNPDPTNLCGPHWEFQTVAPFPPLEGTPGMPKPSGRRLEIMHPAGILMGTLVEVEGK